MKFLGFGTASKVDGPKDDNHEEFEEKLAGSQAMETEPETEDSVKDSPGLIVGGPNACLW